MFLVFKALKFLNDFNSVINYKGMFNQLNVLSGSTLIAL